MIGSSQAILYGMDNHSKPERVKRVGECEGIDVGREHNGKEREEESPLMRRDSEAAKDQVSETCVGSENFGAMCVEETG